MITRVPFIRKFLKDKIPGNISKAIEENLKEVLDLKNRIEFRNRIEGLRNKIEDHFYLLYGNPSIDMNIVLCLKNFAPYFGNVKCYGTYE